MRAAQVKRTTGETDISLSLELEGRGLSEINTGVGFLDHMLTLFARHSRFNVSVSCQGDTRVDDHHTTEDIGIALGQAFRQALGEKRGIERYGDTCLPMDETLVLSSVDISGRGILSYHVSMPTEKVGSFDTELCEEFWQAFAREAGVALHILLFYGSNSHHIIEGIFKSVARTLRKASAIDPEFAQEIPSTKGIL